MDTLTSPQQNEDQFYAKRILLEQDYCLSFDDVGLVMTSKIVGEGGVLVADALSKARGMWEASVSVHEYGRI